MKKGFTLVEVLIMMLIILVLATIAVPTYEKAIEKARLNEVRATLKRIYDSKLRIMDNLGKTTFSRTDFGLENLDFQFKCQPAQTSDNGHVVACNTDDFTYWISTQQGADGLPVCAARRKGELTGAIFTYNGSPSVSPSEWFRCHDAGTGEKCLFYGMQWWDDNGRLCRPINN
ncbi:MAG: prepilin-type N-terminal cleavage/methylation domain-containing protein [Elusimicrobiaceae bacterium]|nr:prepilin-type N-terminal cleavage/methylation domain-containing protein [Elusimicrobiaceae bacterium]